MADNLTPEQRSYCMSRVKGSNTSIEKLMCAELRKRGLRFKTHQKDLPGKPDIVFSKSRVVVLLDGDFWHGYRFPAWEGSLSTFWREKIRKNRARDQRTLRRLRRMGWSVVRIWQHQLKRNLEACIGRVISAVEEQDSKNRTSGVPHR
jgi:DNA mismatch endonuclease (patch repair protein)